MPNPASLALEGLHAQTQAVLRRLQVASSGGLSQEIDVPGLESQQLLDRSDLSAVIFNQDALRRWARRERL